MMVAAIGNPKVGAILEDDPNRKVEIDIIKVLQRLCEEFACTVGQIRKVSTVMEIFHHKKNQAKRRLFILLTLLYIKLLTKTQLKT